MRRGENSRGSSAFFPLPGLSTLPASGLPETDFPREAQPEAAAFVRPTSEIPRPHSRLTVAQGSRTLRRRAQTPLLDGRVECSEKHVALEGMRWPWLGARQPECPPPLGPLLWRPALALGPQRLLVSVGAGKRGLHHHRVHRGGHDGVWPVEGFSVSGRPAVLWGHPLPRGVVSTRRKGGPRCTPRLVHPPSPDPRISRSQTGPNHTGHRFNK